ncbi:MAG: DUF2269 family protein [Acidobacteria bacterium]|nr:DUF2269 family protein [Acidobacteriota bacterium]
MAMLGPRGYKWLKIIHLFFAALWVGGAFAVLLLIFTLEAAHGMELYGVNRAMRLVDDYVIIPGAVGLLLTGILYATLTPWGWFRHRWITTKWIVNIYGVMFGTFLLGPWLNSLAPQAFEQGLAALTQPEYLARLHLLRSWGTFQFTTILFALVISVLKPWRKRSALAGTRPARS